MTVHKLLPRITALLLFSVPFCNGLYAATGPATIIDLPSGCDATTERTNLAAALTAAGYTVTTITTGVVPADLTGQTQVWDIRCQSVLTAMEGVTYTNYLQSGGSLFLMGENTSFGSTRDNSLIGFITSVGGGSLTLTSTNNSQTVRPPFTGPNSLTSVNFRAIAGTTTAGTGSFITTDTNGYGGAIAFGPGSMSAAPRGSLLIVWDVNFLDSAAQNTAGERTLTANLIAYLAAPTPINNNGAVGVPALSLPVMAMLCLLLGGAGILAMRRQLA